METQDDRSWKETAPSAFVLHHVTLSVRDIDRAVAFYRTFDFRLALRWQAEDDSLTIAHLLGSDGMTLELFRYRANADAPVPQMQAGNDLEQPGLKHIALMVADVRATRKALLSESNLQATDIQHGRTGIDYFFIADPDGNWVEIVEDDRSLNPDRPTFLTEGETG